MRKRRPFCKPQGSKSSIPRIMNTYDDLYKLDEVGHHVWMLHIPPREFTDHCM